MEGWVSVGEGNSGVVLRLIHVGNSGTFIVLLLAVWILPVVILAGCGDDSPEGRIVFHSHRDGALAYM